VPQVEDPATDLFEVAPLLSEGDDGLQRLSVHLGRSGSIGEVRVAHGVSEFTGGASE